MKTKHSVIALLAAVALAIPLAFAVGEPENVAGLAANPISENSIGLTWNSAKDSNGGLVNHYRVYYGATSVQSAGTGDYDHQVDTPNNNTSYVVGSLTAGTMYYFSVTAIDSNAVESEAYSLEASATTLGVAAPAEPAEDTTAPTVTQVSAPFKDQVLMVFSESVVLPVSNPQAAFTITEQVVTSNLLAVMGAVLDPVDNTKVVLTTANQTTGMSYVVTAGVAVADQAGNPIVSGNTDSGLFTSTVTDLAPAPAPEEPEVTAQEMPEVVAPLECGNDTTCFYNQLKTCALVRTIGVTEQTQIKREAMGVENGDCVLKYEVASMLDLTNPKILECRIPVASMEERVNRVVSAQGKLFTDENEAKTLCVGGYLNDFARAEFASIPVVDVTPPENITSLMLSFREEMKKFVVMLRWVASINSAKDLVDQILYMSADRGTTYGTGTSLGSTNANHDVPNLEGGKEYTFKITTKDATGNESTGVVKSIRLPQTGAAAGLLLLGSLFGARRLLRRKK
ncbi:MAG: fibronectin type III domain-containing protein [Candidatus Peregrinibacteria bacterium]